LRGEKESKTAGKNEEEECRRHEGGVEARDEGMKAGDIGDREDADKDDRREGDESKDLVGGFEVFGLFDVVSIG
jgi:hypothetical protein